MTRSTYFPLSRQNDGNPCLLLNKNFSETTKGLNAHLVWFDLIKLTMLDEIRPAVSAEKREWDEIRKAFDHEHFREPSGHVFTEKIFFRENNQDMVRITIEHPDLDDLIRFKRAALPGEQAVWDWHLAALLKEQSWILDRERLVS